MNDYIIYSIGFIAQLLFSLRLIVQWITSEKLKKVVAPTLFWLFSLIASILLFIYGFYRNDFAIMLGQVLTYYIYIRNLQIQKQWNKLTIAARLVIIFFPIILLIISLLKGNINLYYLFSQDNISNELLLLGILSQLLFTFRFVYQWINSEKINKSHLPRGFWIISIIGSILIICYAIFRKDPVLFIGQLFGFIIYVRNLMILKNQ